MSVAIVVGIQWGDEGKGKVVDFLTQNADFVVRFQGGNNAGHTVVIDGKKTALGLIPSGILRENTRCLLAAGVVINPFSMVKEIESLESSNSKITKQRLGIARECQLIMPYHLAIDEAREAKRAKDKIGTTKKGIGPAYEQGVNRSGVRICDFFNPSYLDKVLEVNIEHANSYLKNVLGFNVRFNKKELLESLNPVMDKILPMVTNVSLEIDKAIKANKKIMFEGAQGTLLDVIHGSYPFVTSSHTISSYAPVSVGMGSKQVDTVVGVCKAYCTRVGSGPFPTEDLGRDGELLREKGVEFGTVTGRARRCGWFDAVSLRRANRLNGVDKLIVTKLDVLTGFSELKVGVSYIGENGEVLEDFPVSISEAESLKVKYQTFKGWDEDISGVRSFKDLPKNAKTFLNEIERLTETKVCGFSVGPDRKQTIIYDEFLNSFMS